MEIDFHFKTPGRNVSETQRHGGHRDSVPSPAWIRATVFFGEFVTAFWLWLILDRPFAYYHNGPLSITLERLKVALAGPF